ncbi:hypothetical protein D3C75_1051950 [compost metagenome]
MVQAATQLQRHTLLAMGLDAGHLFTQYFQALACGQLLLAVFCLLDLRQLPAQAVQPLAVIGE